MQFFLQVALACCFVRVLRKNVFLIHNNNNNNNYYYYKFLSIHGKRKYTDGRCTADVALCYITI